MQSLRGLRFDTLGITLFLIALVLVSARSLQLRRPDDAPTAAGRSAMCDFQDVVYYPTRAAWAGVNPYEAQPRPDGLGYRNLYPAGNPFPVYTPLIFLVSIPFAVLPLPVAEAAYWLTNVVLLLALAAVSLRLTGVGTRIGSIAGLAGLLLLSRPGHANLYFGQVTLPLVLATLGAWHLATRRSALSGSLLAIALIKPTFGGPLLLLMLARGYFRAVLVGLVIAAVVGAVWFTSFAIREPAGLSLGRILLANQAETEADPNVDPQHSGNRIDIPHVVERLFGPAAAPLGRYVLPLMIVGVAGWRLRSLPENAEGSGFPLLSLSFVCVTIAVCIYHGVYDALVLTLPAVAAWASSMRGGGRLSIADACLTALLLVPAVNYFSSKQFIGLLSQWVPLIGSDVAASDLVWTVVSTMNGLALGLAWYILLRKTKRSGGQSLASGAA